MRVERGRYRIVWTGTLDRPDQLLVFLQAVDALLTRIPALADQLEIDFYGNVSGSCKAIWARFAACDRLVEAVRFHGFVPRRVALQALADADAALVMLGAGPGMEQFVPGKLFDCIGQNKQVLAVLPRGDARDILEELDWGIIANPDVAAIGRAVERLTDAAGPGERADPAGKYDRVALAARLADYRPRGNRGRPPRPAPRAKRVNPAVARIGAALNVGPRWLPG